jgi:hypothetical protein
MAIGNLVAQAVTKTLNAMKEGVADAIKGAMEEEQSQNDLTVALSLRAKQEAGAKESLLAFAQAQMRSTLYTHEQIETVETFLTSMTKLDVQGIKKATTGIIGLAAVLHTDLSGAMGYVQKAMEGNYAALSRIGIRVDETMTKEEKNAFIIEKLTNFYGLATAQTDTFAGSLTQLKNMWGEVGETLAGAIVKNENVRDLIKEVKDKIVELIESGKLDEWADRIAVGVDAAVKGIELLMGIAEKLSSGKSIGDSLADQFAGVIGLGSGYKEFLAEVMAAHADLAKSLKIVKPNMEELALYLRKGGAEWEAYKKAVIEADQQLQKERAMPQYAPAIAATRELTDSQKDLLKAQKAAFSDEIIKQINDAEAALQAYVTTGRSTPEGIRNMEAYIENLRKGLQGLTLPLTVSQKALAEEIRYLRMVGGDIDVSPATNSLLTLEERLYGVGLAAVLASKEVDQELKDAFEVIRKKAGDAANGVGLILKVDLRNDLREKEEQLRRFGNSMPYSEVKKLREEIERLKRALAQGSAWDKFADAAQQAMDSITQYTSAAFSGLDAIFSQSQANKEIAIENEYKRRLDAINKNITDEDERQKAVMALEAEYEIKRSSARAAAAKQAKAIAMMEAVVNTASAVVEALPNIPLAILVAALGAIQIGVIAAQPIPLAKGGYFDQPTLMPGRDGRTYLGGEAGPEVMSPVPVMRQVVREELRALAPAMAGGSFTFNGGITIHAPDISPSGIRKLGNDIWGEMEIQASRRGFSLREGR